MSFLLDTCVLSELTRPKPHSNVLRWFEAQDATALFVSVLTIGEIEKGVAALPAGRKKVALSGWLATLRSTYTDRMLSIDAAIAAIWGRTAARIERAGGTLAVVDGLIAATGMHHGYTVVTRNVSDFAKTGVALLNAWQA
ncbi:MAG: type II toxin-antitoxin system VapC family toxin [Deltaproteobacteria bacterium]|nr:type II toxin-antitoxin system VapC family toxin [Deltaproteobacteria bacterium]MBI3389441.1 type II toxin-antitoxin system VapC family toxin [Deltaproteobacteria bacterium]